MNSLGMILFDYCVCVYVHRKCVFIKCRGIGFGFITFRLMRDDNSLRNSLTKTCINNFAQRCSERIANDSREKMPFRL